MAKPKAALLAVATFLLGLGLCIAFFAVLDVSAIYLIGPAIVVAGGAFATYRSALRGDPRPPRTDPGTVEKQ